VLHPQFWADAVFGGTVSAGEAYIHGLWKCDDLTALVRIMVANRTCSRTVDGGANLGRGRSAPARPLAEPQQPRGSRRNISAHYDLGNDFFALFLDPTMNYSCGIFDSAGATMEQASIAKMDAICRKLDLQPGDHLLEIGTGWGGLAIHAASHYGCRVTTTTISGSSTRWPPSASVPPGSRTASSCCCATTATSRAVRQAGLDRDDRGRRATSSWTPISALLAPA
jgi:cyclopropane-fatty-acyl-phospholipid synthase